MKFTNFFSAALAVAAVIFMAGCSNAPKDKGATPPAPQKPAAVQEESKFMVAAAECLGAGDLECALDNYTQEIKTRPENATALMARGKAFIMSGDPDHAIDDLAKAVRIAPDLLEAYSALSDAYVRRGRMQDALDILDSAIKRDPENPLLYTNRGWLLSIACQTDCEDELTDAINDLSRAIELDHTLEYAFVNRGVTYAKLGKFAEAIEDWKKTIELNPEMISVHYNMGLAYTELGETAKAIESFKTFLETNPADRIKKDVQDRLAVLEGKKKSSQ